MSRILSIAACVFAVCLWSPTAIAVTLEQLVASTLRTNPNILSALEAREATEFELRQARSDLLPTFDLETSAGIQRLDTQSRRSAGTVNDTLDVFEASLSMTQTLYDGGRRKAAIDRQVARIDGASFRVAEQTEAIALALSQEYFQILLQAEVVQIAQRNVGVLNQIGGDIAQGIEGGTLTEADRLQAQEQVISARVQLTEAEEDLLEAQIRLARIVGVEIGKMKAPRSLRNKVPGTLAAAIVRARQTNPQLASARADVNAADADVRGVKPNYLPSIDLEAQASVGNDLDSTDGFRSDLSARLVARWTLDIGGANEALRQEQIRRAGQARTELTLTSREVDESIRLAWSRRAKQGELSHLLGQQASTNTRLVNSYREQFRIGERSLLDVLSAQNSRFSAEVLAKTAAYSSDFANYQILAAMGELVEALGASNPPQAQAYAGDEFGVATREVQPVEYLRAPSRQVNELPFDLLAPIEAEN